MIDMLIYIIKKNQHVVFAMKFRIFGVLLGFYNSFLVQFSLGRFNNLFTSILNGYACFCRLLSFSKKLFKIIFRKSNSVNPYMYQARR